MIAALYVDPRGPYAAMPGVICYTVGREQSEFFRKDDGRSYDGPGPVVAHPPCGPWGKLRHLSGASEAERTLAPSAVGQVRRWGGVLEHPAGSKLWEALGLPLPGAEPDRRGGYTIAVSQCEWGHPARKRTWLYLVGVPASAIEAPPFPGRAPTHWASGSRGKSSRRGAPVPPGIKVCSAQQRNRTPPLFAEYLVRLAQSAAQSERKVS